MADNPRPRRQRKRKLAGAPADSASHAAQPTPVKPWTFLLYLCGDNPDLESYVQMLVDELQAWTKPLERVHVVVQADTLNDGAQRFLVGETNRAVDEAGDGRRKNRPEIVRINTGNSDEAIEFFQWGIERAPSEHVAMIFSGLGISPHYVAEILERDNDFGNAEAKRRLATQNLFSICHDVSHLDALEAHELRRIVEALHQRLGRPIDLVAFDAGQTAFIELAYQLRQHVAYFVAPRTSLPDEGWPLREFLDAWNQRLGGPQPYVEQRAGEDQQVPPGEVLAREFVARLSQYNVIGETAIAPQYVAVDLRFIQSVARCLDHVTSTLLQSLGDWHVLHALLKASEAVRSSAPPECDWEHYIPKFGLIEVLRQVGTSLLAEIPETPEEFGQLERVRHVHSIIESCLQSIDPRHSEDAGEGLAEPARAAGAESIGLTEDDELQTGLVPWLVASAPEPNVGLAVLFPEVFDYTQTRPAAGNDSANPAEPRGTEPAATEDPAAKHESFEIRRKAARRLRESNYYELDFARDVQWASLLGALQLVIEKPHVLWRVVSGMLFGRSSLNRDLLLQQILNKKQSVLSDLKVQFGAFQSDVAPRLSLEPPPDNTPAGDGTTAVAKKAAVPQAGRADREEYRVRYEPAFSSATVFENISPVYRSNVQSALETFERLLNSGEPVDDAVLELERLGRSLGEDFIRDIADLMQLERQQLLANTPLVPHLRLQIPVELMQYPWELMSDRHGMLFERWAVGRQFFTSSKQLYSQRDRGPLRVLVLGDPEFSSEFRKSRPSLPQQLAGAVAEAEAICELFRDLRDRLTGIVEVWIECHIHKPISVNFVRSKLRSGEYDIIHYCGHACFNAADPEGSAWLLSDGMLHAREIYNTLQWCPLPPWLVYANACEAGMDRRSDGRQQYQGDVYGLGSAFLHSGVRGYVAPLWPINDDVAVQMATDFYLGLLIDRLSLGESLYRAKHKAKRLALGADDARTQGSLMPANVALSWASIVLYGDPTQRLFQSLWGGSAAGSQVHSRGEPDGPSADRLPQGEPAESVAPAPGTEFERKTPGRSSASKKRPKSMPRLAQASTRAMLEQLPMSGLDRLSQVRGAIPAQITEPVLELVERDGVRAWRIAQASADGDQTRLVSKLLDQTQHVAVRQRLGVNRGLAQVPVILGRWALKKFVGEDQANLIQQFDQDAVPKERLLLIHKDLSLEPLRDASLPGRGATWRPLAGNERVLLFLHGTFSKTESPVTGFGRTFLTRLLDGNAGGGASPPYKAVLGYDHWTLSKSPLENAQDLLKCLQQLKDERLLNGQRVDLIVHSRGGLVARSFVELLQQQRAVRNVVFLGAPNAGTQLAHPSNWGRLADFLVNLTHLDGSGLFARLSGMLAQFVARNLTKTFIPGLYAQNPETRDIDAQNPANVLHRLHHDPTPVFTGDSQLVAGPGVPRYACIAANYEPDLTDGTFDLSGLGRFLAQEGIDRALESFYTVPNDLVVDTHGAWAFRKPSQQMRTTTAPIPPENVLLFNPDANLEVPPGVQIVPRQRIHHCSLFQQEAAQKFILGLLGLDRATVR